MSMTRRGMLLVLSLLIGLCTLMILEILEYVLGPGLVWEIMVFLGTAYIVYSVMRDHEQHRAERAEFDAILEELRPAVEGAKRFLKERNAQRWAESVTGVKHPGTLRGVRMKTVTETTFATEPVSRERPATNSAETCKTCRYAHRGECQGYCVGDHDRPAPPPAPPPGPEKPPRPPKHRPVA